MKMTKGEELEVEYRAGYLIPTEQVKGKFDIKSDSVLLAEGSHFFCQGHLSAVAIKQQSHNPNYCSDCFKVIRE